MGRGYAVFPVSPPHLLVALSAVFRLLPGSLGRRFRPGNGARMARRTTGRVGLRRSYAGSRSVLLDRRSRPRKSVDRHPAELRGGRRKGQYPAGTARPRAEGASGVATSTSGPDSLREACPTAADTCAPRSIEKRRPRPREEWVAIIMDCGQGP